MASTRSKTTKKEFYVNATINIQVAIPIAANNLTDAVDQASKLSVHDFVEMQGDFMDGDHKITGVWET